MKADISTIREFADEAYSLLYQSGHPEFGAETRLAIVDTAADALAEAGYEFDRERLVAVADALA